MTGTRLLPTRKKFLLTVGGAALLPAVAARAEARRILIVVAHPDDEYAFAATTYRLVRESGWTADQVVITNGEAGFRYAGLAGIFYGSALADEADGRRRLPAVRKEETLRAGRILGIRRHYFLEQRDLGFDRDAALADSSNWDRPKVLSFLGELMLRERYDVVFTLLPTPETHGHHRAAAALALEAVSELPPGRRPVVLGVQARPKASLPIRFSGLEGTPLTRTTAADPVLSFDRTTAFGYRRALDYRIVVNWVIAEHKSQGLFQMDSGRDELEQCWEFQAGAGDGVRLDELRRALSGNPVLRTAHSTRGWND